ncbi:MAG: hypothetical protein WDN04_13780 [Rhodospirillales bacterium]
MKRPSQVAGQLIFVSLVGFVVGWSAHKRLAPLAANILYGRADVDFQVETPYQDKIDFAVVERAAFPLLAPPTFLLDGTGSAIYFSPG